VSKSQSQNCAPNVRYPEKSIIKCTSELQLKIFNVSKIQINTASAK